MIFPIGDYYMIFPIGNYYMIPNGEVLATFKSPILHCVSDFGIFSFDAVDNWHYHGVK
jgi:hypothetical protein